MSNGITVLVEAMLTGKQGGEAGSSERWIEAICTMPEVSKVIVLTSSHREATNSKECIISFWPARERWLGLLGLFHFGKLPSLRFVYQYVYGLFYIH